MNLIPTVTEKWSGGSMISADIFSRLLKERIIFLGDSDGVVTTDNANILIAQMLYLESEDADKPINMYINSPGGSVTAGLAIYDVMQNLRCPVVTMCYGMAMSFGAVLLCAGTKGQRMALPNSRIMIHQPLIHGGGISGQATEIEIEAREMLFYKKRLNEIIAFHCGQSVEKVTADCERNFYLSSDTAKEYGLIDAVILPKRGYNSVPRV